MEMPSASYIDILPFSTADEIIQCCHRRRYRRYYCTRSSRFILLVLCYTATVSCWRSNAFSSPPLSRKISQFTSGIAPSRNSHIMSSVAEIPADSHAYSSPENKPSNHTPGLTDFQRRMKGLVKKNGAAQRDAAEKPHNLKTVHTLLDYKKVLDEGSDKIVVVRFFATWCKVSANVIKSCVTSSSRSVKLSLHGLNSQCTGMQSHPTVILPNGSSLPTDSLSRSSCNKRKCQLASGPRSPLTSLWSHLLP